MTAKQNECGNIPAHDKHTNRCPYQRKAHRVYIAQILRRQIQRVGPEGFHEGTIHGTEQDKPKNDQHLVFS